METVRVLTIDGGGIRGIIPAVVLAEIERRAKKPTHELFDLIVGTSTGGIIALGLTKPEEGNGRPEHSAADASALYEKEGKNIFKRSLWHRVAALENLLQEKYPDAGLMAALDEYLGDTRLADALTEVLVPAYDLEHRQAFFFRSSKAETDDSYNFLMRDAARATSAAPTYFEPLGLDGIAGDDNSTYSLVDGGVYANNPAMCGFIEARVRHPEARRFVVLSLGTGEQMRPIHQEEAENWGLINWARPILGVVFDGVSDTVDYQLNQMLSSATSPFPGSRYLRIQPQLVIANDDMDDASAANIAALKQLGRQVTEAQSGDIDALIKDLAPT